MGKWQKLTLNFTEEQHEGLRRLAFERRRRIAELVRQAVQEWLDRQSASRKEGLNE